MLTFKDLKDKYGFEVLIDGTSSLTEWLERTRSGWLGNDKKDRCRECYLHRLERTAETAKTKGIGRISTTLLYSRYQFHDEIRSLGEDVAKRHGLVFHYEDFRKGWNEGIRLSKEAGLYRQSYCGCLFSLDEAQGAPAGGSQKQGR